MPSTQHPRAEELESYLLNRMRPPMSVRMAEHLLACPECTDRAAGINERLDELRAWVSDPQGGDAVTSTAVRRLASSASQAWYEPASGLVAASGAVLLLSLAIGPSLFRPAGANAPMNVATLNIPRGQFGPVPEQLSLEPVITEPVVSARAFAPRPRRPKANRPSKTFVAPDTTDRSYEVGYLLPPPGPVSAQFAPARFEFAALSTQVGERPNWPVKSKRHPIVRFFGVIAKPFRSDRT